MKSKFLPTDIHYLPVRPKQTANLISFRIGPDKFIADVEDQILHMSAANDQKIIQQIMDAGAARRIMWKSVVSGRKIYLGK